MFSTLLLVALSATSHGLVEQLDSPKYRVRDRAHRTLSALGEIAYGALCRGEHHQSLEVRQRCQKLLGRWEEQRVEAVASRLKPRNYQTLPWIASANNCSSSMVGRYISRARALTNGGGAPIWRDYRMATRLWIVSQVWQRRPEAEIMEQLNRWVAEEIDWIESHGNNYNPPLRPLIAGANK